MRSNLARLVKVLSLLAVLTVWGCGGGGSSDSDSSGLTSSFPADLIVASPTGDRDTSSSSVSRVSRQLTDEDGSPDDLISGQVELAEILAGETITDCDFNLNLTTSTSRAVCYGPTLNYTGHPDAALRDADTADSTVAEDDDGQLPGGDLGLWVESVTSTGEACASAQINAVVGGISSQVNSAIFAMASMVCIARVNGLEVPDAEDETLTLTSQVDSGFTTNGVDFDVTSASLERDDDDADGNKVFIANLVGTATDADGDTQTVTIRLKHVPRNAENTVYRGKLSYTIATNNGEKFGNCGTGSLTGSTDAVSIAYEKSSSTVLTQELHGGNFCGVNADPYESATNFTVDASKKFSATTDPDGWGNNFNLGMMVYNPINGAGDFRYSWQAGPNDANTRVLNVGIDASATDEDDITGCAWFGYGPDIAADGVGDIDRMICNWAGPGSSHTGQELAQEQCLSLSDDGIFTATSSNITYAPTNSCNSSGTVNGIAFTYSAPDLGTSVNGTAVNHNLVDLDEVDMAAYTAPTDVDE